MINFLIERKSPRKGTKTRWMGRYRQISIWLKESPQERGRKLVSFPAFVGKCLSNWKKVPKKGDENQYPCELYPKKPWRLKESPQERGRKQVCQHCFDRDVVAIERKSPRKGTKTNRPTILTTVSMSLKESPQERGRKRASPDPWRGIPHWKKVPKKGDENGPPSRRSVAGLRGIERKSPRKGTKTITFPKDQIHGNVSLKESPQERGRKLVIHVLKGLDSRVLKESPQERGRKLSCKCHHAFNGDTDWKKVPKKGDENNS